MNKPNFNKIKKANKANKLGVDVDQVESDWEAYQQICQESRQKQPGKHYKRGGPARARRKK